MQLKVPPTSKLLLLFSVLIFVSSITLAKTATVMPLLESNIILPLKDNKGKSLSNLHIWFKKIITANWFGYTATNATGGWVSTSGELMEEENIVYTIAMHCSENEREKLIDIAIKLKKAANQEAIYVKECTGEVKLI